MQVLCFIKLLVFSSFFLIYASEAVFKLPPNASVSAVFGFGDSVIDSGNNNFIKTIIKVDYPPYGQDFMERKPTGRFSNGKVPTDIIVEELGIKPVLPPYLDPSLSDEDLITGVNFASGGSGYDPMTSKVLSVLSLPDQLNLFKEYMTKLKGIVGEARANEIIWNESLFVLVIGSNDITNTYFGLSTRKAEYDLPSYINFIINLGSKFLQDLYALGARKIGVLGLPPIGCLPAQRTVRGGIQRTCYEEFNQIAQQVNARLIAELNSLNSKLPQARLVYLDSYNILLDLIRNPQQNGFKISDKGCCGTGTIEVVKICRYAFGNTQDHVFWDSYHPTEKAYRLLVTKLIRQNINHFF